MNLRKLNYHYNMAENKVSFGLSLENPINRVISVRTKLCKNNSVRIGSNRDATSEFIFLNARNAI